MDISSTSSRRVLLLANESDVATHVGAAITQSGIDLQATNDVRDFLRLIRSWRPTHVAIGPGVPERLALGEHGTEVTVIPSGEVEALVRQVLRANGRSTNTRSTLEDLDDALDLQRVSVAYQPKFDTSDDTVYAFEALARWHRPDAVSVSPADFVTLAEITGRIDRLTDAIVDQATTWFAPQYGASDTLLCLNVSGRSLADPGLADRLERRCGQVGLAPQRIVLEVTETSLLADQAGVHEVLVDLRRRGMRLALDDFGAGHASLVQLARHPFTDLKVDRDLVGAVTTNKESRTIVRALVGLAEDLELRIIAEGVEDQPTYEALKELGCVYMQGNYLAPAMEPEALEAWSQR